MIYLYCVLEPERKDTPPRIPEGLDGVTGAVSAVRCGERFLVYGAHDGEEILPRRRLLLSHARVLEQAMETGTVLPMRFGMTCGSIEEVEGMLDARRGDIETAFDRIRGHVEVGVRAAAPEGAALEAALAHDPVLRSQRNALMTRTRHDHFATAEFGRALSEAVAARRDLAQQAMLEHLLPSAVDHIVKSPETDFEVLRAEFLIQRSEYEVFAARVEEAVDTLGFAGPNGCSAQLVGPGPAFHFVVLNLAEPGTEEAA